MEPISMTGLALLQIGISLYNQYKNKTVAEKIKKEQQEAKRKEILDSQKRDREKFLRSCELQERMESEAHRHKVASIRQGFMSSFMTMIHKDNLDRHYPLNISPYIIQRSVIPETEEDIDNVRQELFCILTGSNDANFNSKVLPYIDESICGVLSKYWNETSNHTICCYQNIWNKSADTFSEEDIDNLRVLIPTPTVAVTPMLAKQESGYKLTWLIHFWGTGNDEDLQYWEIDSDVCFENLPKKYTKVEINHIVNSITSYAVCAIGEIADVFYWTNFYQPPLLPSLLAKGVLDVSEISKRQYAERYAQLYTSFALGDFTGASGDSGSLQLAKDIAAINQYNHPERGMAFLNNIFNLRDFMPSSGELIVDSVLVFYRSKTDMEVSTLAEINAALIKNEDVIYLSQFIEQSKRCKAEDVTRQLLKILNDKIISW